jgi:hypothetical protein
MLRWADANGIRVLGYLVAAAVAFMAAAGDRRDARVRKDAWPLFWVVTGLLMLGMALGRAVDAGSWLSNLGRQEAHADGWYANRRAYQGLIILALGAGLVVVVAIAGWWIPRYRRGYVLAATTNLCLACYAAARAVSLHQVDALLYRRHIAGARVDAVIELTGLAAAIAVALWHASKRSVRRSASVHARSIS